MSTTLALRQAALTIPHESTDMNAILVGLGGFGEPMVYLSSGLWSVMLDVHINIAGTTMKVKSDPQSTPLLAAQQCASRVIETVRQFS